MIKETNYLDVYIYDKWSNNSVPLFVQVLSLLALRVQTDEY
jgi:hypothetical protein